MQRFPKLLAVGFSVLLPLFSARGEANRMTTAKTEPPPVNDDVSHVARGLQTYLDGPVRGLWQRPELTPRDRSIVTLTAVIARSQATELPVYLELALANGVKPARFQKSSLTSPSTPVSRARRRPLASLDRFLPGTTSRPTNCPQHRPLCSRSMGAGRAPARRRSDSNSRPLPPASWRTPPLLRNVWLRPDPAPR